MYGIIYKATNKVNGKVYIGQTKNSLKTRMASHKYSAEKKNSKGHFHKAIRKYGWINFEWETLCNCSSLEELHIKEIQYIEYFDCHSPNNKGYNMTKGGDFNAMLDPDIRRRQKESLQISMKAFCGENNVMKRPEVKENHKKAIIKLTQSESWKDSNAKSQQKLRNVYEITFPDYTVEIVSGLTTFCKLHNLQQSKMSSVANGERSHHKGFVCKKLVQSSKKVSNPNTNKIYYFFDPKGSEITITNLNHFAKDNNVSYTCMLYVYQGKQHSHRGYTKNQSPQLCEESPVPL
jgi:group I intron endonuclease